MDKLHKLRSGIFTISLDFELHWGVSDHSTVESYYENLVNEPQVVRRLLVLFKENQVHATWAIVGMMFCKSKNELFEYVSPEHRPSYVNPAMSNYITAESVGENEDTDPFHYANTLIKKINASPNQELATHTFSHYYCLEDGQSPDQFHYDLEVARKVLEREGAECLSIVFPRNQYNRTYLAECRKAGLRTYRGNYPSWMYKPARTGESLFKRLFRLTDAYIPLNGHRIGYPHMSVKDLLNIPASAFFRPYNRKLSFLEPMRIRRIKNEMTAAARKKALYHLWWHPHNFGKNIEENFAALRQVVEHYKTLQRDYGMRSLNMKEIYQEYKHQENGL